MMNKKRLRVVCSSLLILGLSSTAQAALVDRGNGMIYDSDQNLTWLQDANYARTSGYHATGWMAWSAAASWAAGLNVGGYTDWRLPTVGPVDGIAFDYDYSIAGDTDLGYNVSAPGSTYAGSQGSELAYMFYNTLGNLAGNKAGYGLTNTSADGVNFQNIRVGFYWSGTGYASSTNVVWNFDTSNGVQSFFAKYVGAYSWAVRSGDVAPVPLPAAVWLFGTALAGLGLFGRRRGH